jgi:hypothetical protein
MRHVSRAVFESKRQETCALMAEKLAVCGPIVANQQHPQGIISLFPRFTRGRLVIPGLQLSDVWGHYDTEKNVIWGARP